MTDLNKISENGFDRKVRLVVKGNDLAEAKYRLTVQEQKLILIAISKINPTKLDFNNPYRLDIKEVAEAIGIEADGSFYQRVAAAVDKLMTRLVKIKTEDGHIVTHWLQKARYYTGMGYFDFWFDESMKPYLLNLEQYVKYDRKNVLQFQSSYSFRIYEILKKWQGANQKNQLSVKVDQLREALAIRKNEYTTFGNFNNRVLKIAQRELTEQSDITFDYHFWKEGRATAGIVFTIKENIPVGKPEKKKRGRPRNKVDESIKPIQDLYSIMEEDSIYSIEVTTRLEKFGVMHLQSLKNEGLTEEIWNQVFKEETSKEPKFLVTAARRIRDQKKSVISPKNDDHIIKTNKQFWSENYSKYNNLMPSDAYLQSNSGTVITWSDPKFIEKLSPYLKKDSSVLEEDQREMTIFDIAIRKMIANDAPLKIVNRIKKAQEDGIYPNWSMDSVRYNKTNPEYVRQYLVGRAYKSDQQYLKDIFDDVYGEEWQKKAQEKLDKFNA
jgi:plasmid replication initiation protein